jgi:hypothetical protein
VVVATVVVVEGMGVRGHAGASRHGMRTAFAGAARPRDFCCARDPLQVNPELFTSPLMRAVITFRWQYLARYVLVSRAAGGLAYNGLRAP